MTTYSPQQDTNSLKLKPAIKKIAKVDISSLSTKTFFEQYQKASIPVIITGLMDGFPDWDLDYLCKHLGNQEFPIRYYGRSRYQQDKREWNSFGSSVDSCVMPFSEYAQMLRNRKAEEQDNYLGHYSLKKTPLVKELRAFKSIEQQ